MRTITVKQLKKKIDSKEKFKLVNVLSKESFKARHIPGSINIPLNDIETKAKKELPDKKQEIVVYCSGETCEASPEAYRKLESMGYKNVIEFSKGLAGWQDAGYDFD